MSMVYGTNTEYLGSFSTLINNSTFIVRTRKTKNGAKLFVDVTEICHGPGPMVSNYLMAIKQARQAARHYGARSVDFSNLFAGLLSDVKVHHGNGNVSLVHVARSAFAFSAVS